MTDDEKVTHFLNISEDTGVPICIREIAKNKAIALMNKQKPIKRGTKL